MIPVTWGLCLIIEMTVGLPLASTLADHHIVIRNPIVGLFIKAPWLYPEDTGWMIFAAALILCIPFYFMSVWTEGLLARRMARAEQKSEAMRWAWRSNSASYALIAVLLVSLIAAYARK